MHAAVLRAAWLWGELLWVVGGSSHFSFAPWLEDASISQTMVADVPPPLPLNTTHADRDEIDKTLRYFWTLGGYLAHDQRDIVGVHSTYGEITTTGARQLAHEFGLDDDLPPRRSNFLVIGSGVGKLAAHLWLEYGAINRSVGIEISRERHSRGVLGLRRLVESGRGGELRRGTLARAGQCPGDGDDEGKGIELLWGDAFSDDDPTIVAMLRATTHIYVASLCFPDELMGELSRLVRNESRVPSLVAVASIRELEGLYGSEPASEPATAGGESKWEVEVVEMQMSWSRASVRVYKKVGSGYTSVDMGTS